LAHLTQPQLELKAHLQNKQAHRHLFKPNMALLFLILNDAV